MKKLFTAFSILLLAIAFTVPLSAQQQMQPDMTAQNHMQQMKVTPSPMMTMNKYQLAYPGMLPDNPLYILKTFRDKIIEFFISDPQKKASFYLLLADKNIAMVPLLVAKQEQQLATMTALKGENYYTMIILTYKNNGLKPDSVTYQKLLDAADKHQQVLMNLLSKVGGDGQNVLQQVINSSKANISTLQKIYKGN